jgi:hypothetical protein
MSAASSDLPIPHGISTTTSACDLSAAIERRRAKEMDTNEREKKSVKDFKQIT